MILYAVVDDALSPDSPLGDSLEVFVRREHADRFIEDPRSASEECSLWLGGSLLHGSG